jgi:predicted metal-binding membrane protein
MRPIGGLDPALRFRLSVGIPVLAFATAGWWASIFILQNSLPMAMSSSIVPISSMASVFFSPDAGIIASFLLVWVVGMVAMMFPAMVPVVSMYSGLVAKKEERQLPRYGGPALFLAGYLSLYALLGLGLFALVYAVFQIGTLVPWLGSLSLVGLAVVLIVTGLWQLSPFKETSLSKCVSPLAFFMAHSKKGASGALRMGAEHGYYCVACCWMYMLVMLAVAAMSIVSMILLSGIIIAEKVFFGRKAWFKWFSAVVFFSLAVVTLAFPASLVLGL